MSVQTRLFPCLSDNYGVLLHDSESGATAAIDAPEAAPIEAALAASGWRLTDILVTHHHADHTGGIAELKEKHGCRVVAPAGEAARIPLVDETVRENDRVRVGGLEARVLETPGHTSGHISYVFPADKLAFVGDTLFSIGCGRVIEGTPEMMWNSLLKLRELPDDTASTAATNIPKPTLHSREPSSRPMLPWRRGEDVERLIAAREPTIPTTIGEEKAANPFLRADVPEVAPVGRALPGRRHGRCLRKSASARTGLDRPVPSAAEVIRLLELLPHPEGGHFRQTFRDARTLDDGRPASTAIYFLLARGERSHWHKIDAVEVWHYHSGAPLVLEIAATAQGPIQRITLGPDLAWANARRRSCRPIAGRRRKPGEWSLAGCTVAPGFDFAASSSRLRLGSLMLDLLRTSSAGERHRARPIGPRPGVRDK